MARRTSTTFLASLAALPLVALAVAGCGSASGSSGPPTTANGQPATVGIANGGLGKILVNSKSRTLYLFRKDVGTKSECTGACAQNWPPLLTKGAPKAGTGAKAGLLGTTRRSDGTTQVTYNGHPLYTFVADKGKPGSTKGQGIDAFGARWYVVAGKGTAKTGGY